MKSVIMLWRVFSFQLVKTVTTSCMIVQTTRVNSPSLGGKGETIPRKREGWEEGARGGKKRRERLSILLYSRLLLG